MLGILSEYEIFSDVDIISGMWAFNIAKIVVT